MGNGTETSETVTKYYRALGRLVAIRRNGILYWIGTDHLGGTVRVADTGFDPVGQMRYSPYGASRDDASLLPHDYLFTDQQLDASIGLYWYASRAYDQSLGRFTCPDTIVPSPSNPQSLNRFAYCANNPLRYVDPTGHIDLDGKGKVIYDHPDWLSPEDRQALFDHNSDPSIANGSKGAEVVYLDGGGGDRGPTDWQNQFALQHGTVPTPQDWWDNRFLQQYAPKQEWTEQLWRDTYEMRQNLYNAGMTLTGGGWSQEQIRVINSVVTDLENKFGSAAQVKNLFGTTLVSGGVCNNDSAVPGCVEDDGRLLRMTGAPNDAYGFAALVTHEFGHVLHYKHPEMLQAFNALTMCDAKLDTQVPTEYSWDAPREQFAESFMVYMGYGRGAMINPGSPLPGHVIQLFDSLKLHNSLRDL